MTPNRRLTPDEIAEAVQYGGQYVEALTSHIRALEAEHKAEVDALYERVHLAEGTATANIMRADEAEDEITTLKASLEKVEAELERVWAMLVESREEAAHWRAEAEKRTPAKRHDLEGA
jgi:prefoldin subunit 5